MQIQTFNSDSQECREFVEKYSHDGVFEATGFAIMAVCNSGSLEFVTDDDVVEIKAGTGIFIGDYKFQIRNISHDMKATICLQTQESMKELYDGQTLYQFNRLMYRPRFFYMEPTKARLCSFTLQRAAVAANDPDSDYGNQIASCYIKIILYNALDINRRQSEKENSYEKRENIISDQFISLVNRNHTTIRKVKEYAAMMGLTPKYLAANVLAATGRHAGDWIDDYTIREIKSRLKHSEDSIQQIAFEMNFSTPSHLTKFFGDKVGMTPLTYRKLKTRR